MPELDTMDIDATAASPAVDQERAGAFADRLFGLYTAGFVTYMIDIGHRTGLFEAFSQGPGTCAELATRAGLQERYVREWLGAIVTAEIAHYEPITAVYTLPVEHAVCLSGDGPLNVAPVSALNGLLGRYVEPVARAFREGGGVPYSDYRPDFTDVMDQLNRPLFDGLLTSTIVPLAGVADRLAAGVRVADLGCGTGHSTNVLAEAFPASTFVGYDLAADAIERARGEASELKLPNVTFEVQDVTELPTDPGFNLAFAFDAIHDQRDPAGVLARVFEALAPGGVFVMFDVRASSLLERNVGNPFAPWFYGVSTLHCMTVSLAAGGAGLGTVWGEELAIEMLAAAGFVDVEVHEVPGDPFDSVYVARKPS